MPIDRRITNGLAWAGALLVVAIPAADIAISQFGGRDRPQLAVVDADAEAPAPGLPTPVAERPRQVVAEKPEAKPAPVPAQEPPAPEPGPEIQPDPVTTATAEPVATREDAVETFLKSGRPLPGYISDAGGDTPARPAPAETTPATASVPQTAAAAKPEPETVLPEPETEAVAALPPARVVGYPTPVSQRPAPIPQVQAVRPPLVIDTDEPIITAEDLEDWESGPLSEFLASRQGGGRQLPADYDPDGFFLDEGPNSGARYQRFPRAYGDQYYPFE